MDTFKQNMATVLVPVSGKDLGLSIYAGFCHFLLWKWKKMGGYVSLKYSKHIRNLLSGLAPATSLETLLWNTSVARFWGPLRPWSI